MHKKIKLSLVLPILQVLLAAVLFQWSYRIEATLWLPGRDSPYVSTPKFVCWGLSAPAFWATVVFDALPLAWTPARILGFQSEDFAFMIGVGITWFAVGRTLDRRQVKSATTRARKIRSFLARAVCVLLACWSVAFGIRELPLSAVSGIFILGWAGGLFASAQITTLAAIQIGTSVAIANWLSWAFRLQSPNPLLVYPALVGSLFFLVGGLISVVRHKYGVVLGLFAACLSWPYFAHLSFALPWRDLLWIVTIRRNDLCAILMLAFATIYLLVQTRRSAHAQNLAALTR